MDFFSLDKNGRIETFRMGEDYFRRARTPSLDFARYREDHSARFVGSRILAGRKPEDEAAASGRSHGSGEAWPPRGATNCTARGMVPLGLAVSSYPQRHKLGASPKDASYAFCARPAI